jgi:molybdenum-dependent DNA-binding transcriptional regulator ModE
MKAAELMGVSYRHAKRLKRRYQEHGDAGLVHALRGRPACSRQALQRCPILRTGRGSLACT